MFEKLKDRFDKGWIRVDQLKRYVQLGIITPVEFTTICKEDYVA